MLGSSVLPDLLETMQRILWRSTFASMALICAGSVESRTCSSGNPFIFPNVMRRTSGHRLEPPMPSKSASLNRAFFTSPATCFRTSMCAICSSVMVSQPSQLLSSVPLQSEASFCQRRERIFESRLLHVPGDLLQNFNVRHLLFGDGQPAEPVTLVRTTPERSILLPETRDFIILLPVFERPSNRPGKPTGQLVGQPV